MSKSKESLPYCGYLEDNYNRRYGWARMARSHAIMITSTGMYTYYRHTCV
jgi:hypothetical protein